MGYRLSLVLYVLSHCGLLYTTSSAAESLQGVQVLAISKGIARLIESELVSPFQFSSQVQYLSGGLTNYAIDKPLINVAAINVSATTAEVLYGLYVATTLDIVGVSLTLSSGSYLGYMRGLTGVISATVRAATANSTCKTTGVGLGHKPYVTSDIVQDCNPLLWKTYTTAAANHGHGSFATPVLDQTVSAFGQMAILPYSVALTNLTTGKIEGVVTTNMTITSTMDLFSIPDTVYYVMTTKASKFLLVLNSVGESLNFNGSLFSAFNAKNTVIRKSAQYLAQLATIPQQGAHYTITGESNKSATLIVAVAPFSDSTRTLNMLAVTVMYVPALLASSSATNSSCPASTSLAQTALLGPALSAAVLAECVGVILKQAIAFGESMAFLAGSGAVLNITPYPVQLNNTSSSLQILRGMMSAYGFQYGMDYVFECALVDDSSGAYAGYTITNTMFTMNASCPELTSMDGTVYPAVDENCLVVSFTNINGQPQEPAYMQKEYDVRSQGWYKRVKATGLSSTYGAFSEPAYDRQGIGIAVPVYGDSNEFLGAVEVFMQTVILAEQNTVRSVNVSFLMTADQDIIGTSEDPIATLVSNGGPIPAVNYTNRVVAAAATYIVENAINDKGVFFFPYSDTVLMQIAIARAKISTRSAINWLVASVTLVPVVETSEEPVDPVEPVASQSDSSSAPSSLDIAAVTVGSLGLVGFVAALAVAALWLCRGSVKPPTIDEGIAEVELGATPASSNPMVQANVLPVP